MCLASLCQVWVQTAGLIYTIQKLHNEKKREMYSSINFSPTLPTFLLCILQAKCVLIQVLKFMLYPGGRVIYNLAKIRQETEVLDTEHILIFQRLALN